MYARVSRSRGMSRCGSGNARLRQDYHFFPAKHLHSGSSDIQDDRCEFGGCRFRSRYHFSPRPNEHRPPTIPIRRASNRDVTRGVRHGLQSHHLSATVGWRFGESVKRKGIVPQRGTPPKPRVASASERTLGARPKPEIHPESDARRGPESDARRRDAGACHGPPGCARWVYDMIRNHPAERRR